ncbi:MAG: phosphoglycerate kinase, partial [Bacteroidia bacterium]
MKTIDDFNFSGQKALLRVDFNVPLDDAYHITDDTRIKAALPTIQKIIDDGGSVILMSHLGRPKSGFEEKYSLFHVQAHLSRLLTKNVIFAKDSVGPAAHTAAADLQTGEILLLENLRFHKEEEKGDEGFAKELASLGDVYVNDAFGTAHRSHASTAVIAKFFPDKKFAGYLMASEIKNANEVLENTKRPFTAILGGAKVSDKILLINKLIDKVDKILIGGGMAYTFIKAQG